VTENNTHETSTFQALFQNISNVTIQTEPRSVHIKTNNRKSGTPKKTKKRRRHNDEYKSANTQVS